jgi:hypothetical protein
LLGYSQLAERLGVEAINEKLLHVETMMEGAQKLGGVDRLTLSDTFLLWKQAPLTMETARDMAATGLSFLARALSLRIPIRGALVRGSLVKRLDVAGGGTLLGTALVRAHKLDRGQNLMTLLVARDVSDLMREHISELVRLGVFRTRPDGVLTANPLGMVVSALSDGRSLRQKLDGYEPHALVAVFTLRFLLEQQQAHFERGDYESRVAQKYSGTIAMIRDILGEGLFADVAAEARRLAGADFESWRVESARRHSQRR